MCLHGLGCVCVRVCVALFIDACRMVGIQRRLLNYMCTKTAGLQTRRASLPASRRVGQAPGSASTNAAPVYFSCFCLIPSFFSQLTCFQASELWRRTFHFFFLQKQHKHSHQSKKNRSSGQTQIDSPRNLLLVCLIVDRRSFVCRAAWSSNRKQLLAVVSCRLLLGATRLLPVSVSSSPNGAFNCLGRSHVCGPTNSQS